MITIFQGTFLQSFSIVGNEGIVLHQKFWTGQILKKLFAVSWWGCKKLRYLFVCFWEGHLWLGQIMFLSWVLWRRSTPLSITGCFQWSYLVEYDLVLEYFLGARMFWLTLAPDSSQILMNGIMMISSSEDVTPVLDNLFVFNLFSSYTVTKTT